MTQTLHQRRAIAQYNKVVALRPRRMPDAWRRSAEPSCATVATSPLVVAALRPTLWRRIRAGGMFWVCAAGMAVILVVDLAIIASLITGATP